MGTIFVFVLGLIAGAFASMVIKPLAKRAWEWVKSKATKVS